MKKYSAYLFLVLLLLSVSYSSWHSYELEKKKRALKADLIELSDIKYGMFNVDQWKEQLAHIITVKLKELKLEGDEKEKAKRKIESFLYTIVRDFEKSYRKENKEKALFGISIKNMGADFFGVFDKFKKDIPSITDSIINFLETAENRESIKNYILDQLDRYRDSTFQQIDYTTYNSILKKYQATDSGSSKKAIGNQLEQLDQKLFLYNSFLFVAYLSLLLYILIIKNHADFNILVYVLLAFQLLALGIVLPMIDIDARISVMEFKLMGESISFKDQVLYFKSKSIVEMSQIMLSQDKMKVMLVGILVVTFSVVFPVAKLFSTLLLLLKRQLNKTAIVSFLVFKSGKWSMADVMVVAIFMSYIGFTGIISSQLDQLEKISSSLNILTTNNSELQNGFYFFLGFVILSISISKIITGRYSGTSKELSKV